MHRFRLLLLLAAAGLALVACGDDSDVTGGADPGGDGHRALPTADTEYWSIQVTEDGVERPLVADTTISLRLGDGTLGASLGCNHLGASFHVEDGRIIVGSMSTTEMGCDPERHAQDEWFADFLGAGPTYSVEGTNLVLGTESTRIVFVERSAVDPDRPLEGTRWTVDGFLDGETAMSMAIDVAGTIVFEAETSTATGSDGCNDFSVPYEVDDTDVRFGEAVVTDRACPESREYQDRVQALFSAEVVGWTIAHDALTLLAPDGRGVTFRADG